MQNNDGNNEVNLNNTNVSINKKNRRRQSHGNPAASKSDIPKSQTTFGSRAMNN